MGRFAFIGVVVGPLLRYLFWVVLTAMVAGGTARAAPLAERPGVWWERGAVVHRGHATLDDLGRSGDDEVEVMSVDDAGTVALACGGHTILLGGPYYSNHPMGRVLFGVARPDLVRVSQGLATLGSAHALQSVDAILIGHAHIDHAGDLPAILPSLPEATVYGSRTLANLLAAMPTLRGRIQAVPQEAVATGELPGAWIPVARGMRAMPVASTHAPHLRRPFALRVFDGIVAEESRELPANGWGWRLGEVSYAWVVDCLDSSGEPVFRMYYDDAAPVDAADGLVPVSLVREHRFDLAVLTAPGREDVSVLLSRLRPGWIALSHWTDFFSAGEVLKPVPVVLAPIRFNRLLSHVDGITRTLPGLPTPPLGGDDEAVPRGLRWAVLRRGVPVRFGPGMPADSQAYR